MLIGINVASARYCMRSIISLKKLLVEILIVETMIGENTLYYITASREEKNSTKNNRRPKVTHGKPPRMGDELP